VVLILGETYCLPQPELNFEGKWAESILPGLPVKMAVCGGASAVWGFEVVGEVVVVVVTCDTEPEEPVTVDED
jgi:hypothetical protein